MSRPIVHYTNSLHGCGTRLSHLVSTAFHAVYGELVQLLVLAGSSFENVTPTAATTRSTAPMFDWSPELLLVFLHAWDVSWQPQDYAFLHDCRIFSVFQRFMSYVPTSRTSALSDETAVSVDTLDDVKEDTVCDYVFVKCVYLPHGCGSYV